MTVRDDPRVAEAKTIPTRDVIERLGIAGLNRMGNELIGPCPLCGGRDRFGVNLQSKAFLCRKCDLRGGDQIALAMQVQGVDFRAALQFLCGDAPAHIDPVEMERRRKRAAESERKQKALQEKYRRKALADARSMWSRARPDRTDKLRAYLGTRGFTEKMIPLLPKCLRFLPDHPYVKKVGREYITMYRGPCMIAAIQAPDGKLSAVHQTWLDKNSPHGKARILHEGQEFPAKLVRGSKKAGAIRLRTPQDADMLVMGEGIETTLTAMVADTYAAAAYWAGVDLGNMAGRMQKVQGQNYSGLPDMSDREAFVPPAWVKRLIYIMDGDSDPDMTRAKLECGLQRAMACRPGLWAQIVFAGEGVDLNDVLMRGDAPEDSDHHD